jgi:hypothetical protein
MVSDNELPQRILDLFQGVMTADGYSLVRQFQRRRILSKVDLLSRF